MEAIHNRNLTCCDISNHLGDEEGVELRTIGLVNTIVLYLVLEGLTLEEKLMAIGQAVYQQQQASGAAGGPQPGPDAAQGGKKDDGVVDAEVVDD